ncbi:Hsp33 family molecular chaperone HslO [Lysobacter sp. TY2-98]|uniref:Hsp33 family molecular chaperone HslO n=1 Tax=Lysobacter sp. TY2-98 TaxID=2290922 RepID=UPI000E20198E|nr:Hsp33 family molecular chaperone HslO [Lysobacter sp. TY2-98]AXK71353.1 Hsp33 family molecular chaperone HslO [Lysobacter sp. TY2-98]
MTDPISADGRDHLVRFLIHRAGVRGVHVRLDETWRHIREREQYPAAAMTMLGQACAAAALFTGHAKVDGRLSVQMRSDGAIRTLFAECTAAGTLRGIVQLAEDAPGEVSADLRDLGHGGILAITIENHGMDGEPVRYQGLVPLEAHRLDAAFEDYFRQSEQLPTRLLLAANGDTAAGLMVQKLPGDEGDADGWNRIGALFDTLGEGELLATDAVHLLHRLFHEDGVELLADKPLAFGCSCSRARVESMLVAIGDEEARLAAAGGEARIRCEFCGQSYVFSPDEVDTLFETARREMASPDRPQ